MIATKAISTCIARDDVMLLLLLLLLLGATVEFVIDALLPTPTMLLLRAKLNSAEVASANCDCSSNTASDALLAVLLLL